MILSSVLAGTNCWMFSQPGWRKTALVSDQGPRWSDFFPTRDWVLALTRTSYAVLVVRLLMYIMWLIVLLTVSTSCCSHSLSPPGSCLAL